MNKLLPALFVILVFPVIFQLLLPGFYTSDDGGWMIIRFSSFYQELSDFQFPVRFLHRLNHGYGYPVATFLYPGFMYIASFFKLLGFGFIASVKGVLILSIFSAFVGMFLFLKNHFHIMSALVGACLYIYNPYFLWDIYKRGSVGEVLAFGVVPFILYCIDSNKRIIAGFLTALLIISHNTLAILFLPFILLYVVIHQVSDKVGIKTIITRISIYLAITLGVSAFFWVPALFELPLTAFRNIAVSNFSDYFVSGYSLLGAINIVILVCSLVYMLIKRKISAVLYTMTGVSFLSLFLAYGISSQFWTDDFLGKFVQFPFRFLSLFAITVSYLGAFLFAAFSKYIPVFAALCIGFIIVSAFPFISNVEHTDVEDSYYVTNVDSTTVKNEYMPVWVKNIPTGMPSQKIEKIDEETVQINTIYWPGHSVHVDSEKVPVDYSNDQGVIRVMTDAPIENIQVTFGETQLRALSDAITLFSIAVACILIVRKTTYA